MTDDALKRLHVTPLSPALLETVLNPALRSLAIDVSFHSIETFPENDYGYITLPIADADKLTKKLNGSILKGKKFKIQEAMAKKRLADDSLEAGDTRKKSRGEKSSKKTKTKGETVPGVELPSGRKVKRGWTEDPTEAKEARKSDKSKSKDDAKRKRSQRSKYTDQPECLFRTVPPPNKKAVDGKEEKQEKKSKRAEDGVVIHEFAQTTTHPKFLRETDNGSEMDMTSEYVDGKGWVDRAGNIREPAVVKTLKKRNVPPPVSSTSSVKPKSAKQPTQKSSASTDAVDSDWTSSSGSSLDSSSEEEDATDSEAGEDSTPESKPSPPGSDPEGPSSQSASESDNDPETADESNQEEDVKEPEKEPDVGDQQTAQSDSATEDDESPLTPEADTEVHPLEALFKRSIPTTTSAPQPALEVKTQFSFFGKNDDIDEDEEMDDRHNIHHPEEPQTPFTKRDMQGRGLRSAAPTPDTGAVSHTKFFEEDLDEDDEDTQSSPQPATIKKQTAVEESDFAKWFWENRGDNNRTWKRRRREAGKEKRQTDNRRRGGLKGK